MSAVVVGTGRQDDRLDLYVSARQISHIGRGGFVFGSGTGLDVMEAGVGMVSALQHRCHALSSSTRPWHRLGHH